jgi:predicted Zn-dependent peptidase
VASFVSLMLDEGAGERDALAIADAIDYLGASLGSTNSFDSSSVRLEVPVSRLAEALPVMADVALRPTFPESELDRIRKERLTALLQARDDPASIAAAAFPRLVYGPTHRYGTAAIGTPDTIRALTVGDLRTFHATHYRPDNATLLVVGDVTADEVFPLVEEVFGTWRAPAGRKPATTIPAAPQLAGRQVFLIDKPGAAQSQVRIGWIGVSRATPDYFPITVLNTILGGAFTSRLNQNLREEHGYSYGARSGFTMRAAAGPFQAAAGVQTDKTAEALTEFFKELEGIGEPIPNNELAKARNYVALGFPSEFETTGDILRRLEERVVYDLPEDYFASYVPNIRAVDVTDVQRAAQRYVQPDNMAVVVVGDASIVEGPIRALELGPMRVVPLDEIMGKP